MALAQVPSLLGAADFLSDREEVGGGRGLAGAGPPGAWLRGAGIFGGGASRLRAPPPAERTAREPARARGRLPPAPGPGLGVAEPGRSAAESPAGDMQQDGGQAAELVNYFFPALHVPCEPPPGNSTLQARCQDVASLPVPKVQDTEEPKRRKGGWPRGKKRKPPKDLSVPRAPTTGYVIFLNEQRSQLRATHPDLPFTEITKMLAAQWAQLAQEKKQRYIDQADEDKQRYLRELQAYKRSEAYQAFLRRQAALRALCGPETPRNELESEGLDLSAAGEDESGDLYCHTCSQFFSSLHNKKEHLLGRQHLHNLTGEFRKDSAEHSGLAEPSEEEEGQLHLNEEETGEEAESPAVLPLARGGLIPEKSFTALDMGFWQEFIFKLLRLKELELGELRRALERAGAEQEALQRQLAEYQKQQRWLEVELAGLRTYGVVLEKELENLNLALMRSHFGLQVMDTAQQCEVHSAPRHLGGAPEAHRGSATQLY
ncbi:uncharacterized protein RHO17_016227 [Thomomys bottae]